MSRALCIFKGILGVQQKREVSVLETGEGRKGLLGVSGGRPKRVIDVRADGFQRIGTDLEREVGKISGNCQRCCSSTSYQGRDVASILSQEAVWAKIVPAQPLVYGNAGIAKVRAQAPPKLVVPQAEEGRDRAEGVCSVCD